MASQRWVVATVAFFSWWAAVNAMDHNSTHPADDMGMYTPLSGSGPYGINNWETLVANANATGRIPARGFDVSTPYPAAPIDGWTLAISVTGDVPLADSVAPFDVNKTRYFSATSISLSPPTRLVFNTTEGPTALVDPSWRMCVFFFTGVTLDANKKLQNDDGSCSAALSKDCIKEIEDSTSAAQGVPGECRCPDLSQSCLKNSGLVTTPSCTTALFSHRELEERERASAFMKIRGRTAAHLPRDNEETKTRRRRRSQGEPAPPTKTIHFNGPGALPGVPEPSERQPDPGPAETPILEAPALPPSEPEVPEKVTTPPSIALPLIVVPPPGVVTPPGVFAEPIVVSPPIQLPRADLPAVPQDQLSKRHGETGMMGEATIQALELSYEEIAALAHTPLLMFSDTLHDKGNTTAYDIAVRSVWPIVVAWAYDGNVTGNSALPQSRMSCLRASNITKDSRIPTGAGWACGPRGWTLAFSMVLALAVLF